MFYLCMSWERILRRAVKKPSDFLGTSLNKSTRDYSYVSEMSSITQGSTHLNKTCPSVLWLACIEVFSDAVFFQMSRTMFLLFNIQLHRGPSSIDIRAVLCKVGEWSSLLSICISHKCFSVISLKVHSVPFSELSLSFTKCMLSVDRNHPLARHMYDQESLESCCLL